MFRPLVIGVVCAVFGLAVFLHTLLYSDSWRQREKVRVELAALEGQNLELEHRVELLRDQISAFRERPDVQERMVRRELGYVASDEIILDLEQK